MAPTDAADSFPSAADRAVLLYRQDEVLTATGIVAANLRQQWTQADLVEAHKENQQQHQELTQPLDELDHHGDSASRASFRATCFTSRGNERWSSSSVGSSDERGISTRSTPTGISCRASRNASRYSRRSRLRS